MRSKHSTTTNNNNNTAATTGGHCRGGRIIRLDEEEREILRKLGEGNNGGYEPVMRPNNKVNKEIMRMPNKMEKLESKKSFEDINESAEKFIHKFKQQLLLQRLESLEKFDKMLARGL